jgi:hypothetical protein
MPNMAFVLSEKIKNPSTIAGSSITQCCIRNSKYSQERNKDKHLLSQAAFAILCDNLL